MYGYMIKLCTLDHVSFLLRPHSDYFLLLEASRKMTDQKISPLQGAELSHDREEKEITPTQHVEGDYEDLVCSSSTITYLGFNQNTQPSPGVAD